MAFKRRLAQFENSLVVSDSKYRELIDEHQSLLSKYAREKDNQATDLEEEYRKQLNRQREQAEREYSKAEQQREEEMQRLKQEMEERIASVKDESARLLDRERKLAEERQARQQEEHDRIISMHAGNMEDAKRRIHELTLTISELDKNHRDAIKEHETALSAQRKQMADQFASKQRELAKQHADAIDAINSKSKVEYETLKNEHADLIATERHQCTLLKEQHDQAFNAFKISEAERQNKISEAMEQTINHLKKQIQVSESSLDDATSRVHDMTSQLHETARIHREELSNMEAELKASHDKALANTEAKCAASMKAQDKIISSMKRDNQESLASLKNNTMPS